MSPFEKIDLESQLTGYSSAGCITYVELDHSIIHNTEALEKIVDHAMEKDIPYLGGIIKSKSFIKLTVKLLKRTIPCQAPETVKV